MNRGMGTGSESYFASLRDVSESVMSHDTSRYSSYLRVADVPCAIRVNDPGLLAALTDGLSDVAPYGTSNDRGLRITGWACDVADLPLPPPPEGGAEVALRGELPAVDGQRYRFAFFAHSRTLMAADVLAGECIIITESSHAFTGFDRASPMRGPLSWLLLPRGRVLVHAGAVAKAGKAALLIGPGGAGKSTLATWAVQHGWEYIGDDLVAVSNAGNFRVYSLYSTAKLAQATPYPLPDTAYERDWQEWGAKKIYRLDREFTHSIVASAKLVAVVLIDRDGDKAGLQRLSPAVATQVVAATTHTLLPGAGPEVLQTLAAATRSTPCWRLNPGAEPETALNLLETTLEEARPLDAGAG